MRHSENSGKALFSSLFLPYYNFQQLFSRFYIRFFPLIRTFNWNKLNWLYVVGSGSPPPLYVHFASAFQLSLSDAITHSTSSPKGPQELKEFSFSFEFLALTLFFSKQFFFSNDIKQFSHSLCARRCCCFLASLALGITSSSTFARFISLRFLCKYAECGTWYGDFENLQSFEVFHSVFDFYKTLIKGIKSLSCVHIDRSMWWMSFTFQITTFT